MPKTTFSGTAMAATIKVSLMADSASGSLERLQRRANAVRQRLAEDDDQRQEEKRAR